MTQHSDVSQPNALKPGQTIKPLPGADHDHAHEKGNLIGLVIGSIGVVYGDIGTSPLYAPLQGSQATARER